MYRRKLIIEVPKNITNVELHHSNGDVDDVELEADDEDADDEDDADEEEDT